jgi:16S rRNA G966 N2-methylase RsmD
MKFHPVADIFPMLPEQELLMLSEDIKANGLKQPIWTSDEMILDGRNRYRACKIARVDPAFKEFKGGDPLAFVLSLNLHRRHLNESQRAGVAAKIANMTKSDGGKLSKTNKNQASANLPMLVSQPKAAEMLNVGERIVRSYKAVERDAPELTKRIDAGEITVHEAQKEIKASNTSAIRKEMARASENTKPSDRWAIHHADMMEWKSLKRYDYIITDPPYPKEFLVLYEQLALRANEWLKPGGLLIAMCGQSYLNNIYESMSKHLQYYWTASYLTPGQPTPLRQVNVNTTWKPLLIFTRKGEKYTGRIFGDVFKSDANEKDMHKWGQSKSGMLSIVSGICLPGESILDPFCGAGTTGVAAIEYGCYFDGVDIDNENCKISRKRIGDTKKN